MSRYKSFHTELERYIESLEIRELTKDYIRRNEQILLRIYRILKQGKKHTEPKLINYDDLKYIRDQIPISDQENRSTRNQRFHIDIFRAFLRYCGNYIKTPPFRNYIPDRPRNTAEEYDLIMQETELINTVDITVSRIQVLLGSLGIRRAGQLRLRPENIHNDYIYVVDKGRNGGKPRTVPIDPLTFSLLKDYLDYRRDLIRNAIAIRPDQTIPERLLIWKRTDNRIGSVKKSKFDKNLQMLSKLTGVKTTAHRMRRYGSTEIWKITKDLQILMRFGGWSSETEAVKYPGLDLELSEAVGQMMTQRYSRYTKNVPRAGKPSSAVGVN